ncbi:FAD-binding oxidoreductase [Zooshikella harenae]|uniref:2Fe-2S iron-sulfur cluster binding domain-containing protein n=1 Tax=Zooshikella harenae TaxID=2827238 RepID=A0ABS5Z8W6_9GAMM|nr:FAD-binding oxidoreductase [Zooshikella harenae]MBU2710368.1 2Fe-2S iron-sulfur cluster binding domain-containing protein [Zooshikella harenae]
MPIIKLTSGIHFKSQRDISILEAASQAQVLLPYSCKNGRCSACRCKLISGKTLALQPEIGLSKYEKAEGWILSCIRSAETDVLLEAENLDGISLPHAKMLPCRISQIQHLAPNVIKVNLRLPPAADFYFIPGQYIDVVGPTGVCRSYSLANADFKGKVLELHIRAFEGGAMSQYWFNQAKVNDLLRINGPLGTFFLRNTAGIDLIFLATGTGIAPIKAMLESITALPSKLQPNSVTILWGGRTLQDLYLDIICITSNKFTYVPVLSRPTNCWSGSQGYIQDVLLSIKPNLSKANVYACGSVQMIHDAKECLTQAGLSPKHFYSDAFVCSGKN